MALRSLCLSPVRGSGPKQSNTFSGSVGYVTRERPGRAMSPKVACMQCQPATIFNTPRLPVQRSISRSCEATAPMDHTAASHSLPDVGSFSYSWPTSLPNRNDHAYIAAPVGRDPAPASRCSFDFRPPHPGQTAAMADADQMFLNGLLLPLQRVSQEEGEEDGDAGTKGPVLRRSLSLDSSQRMVMVVPASKRHRTVSLNSSPRGPQGGSATPARSSSVSRSAVVRASRLRLPSFGRSRRKWREWTPSWYYLRFVVPWCRQVVGCAWRRTAMAKSNNAARRAERCDGTVCDLGKEIAIRDAILHCKRSL